MPEGDTIFRTAVRLRQVLQDQVLAEVKARDPQLPVDAMAGRTVSDLEARGKHLLIHLDGRSLDGRSAIHSHLGMTGSWHVYAPREPWRKPARRAHLVLEVPAACVVCFSPKTLEILSPTALRRHRWLGRLGPDLLAREFDEDEALRRFRRHDQSPIGDAILNQSIICGIGNVYKSEALFLCGINPFYQVGALEDEALRQCLACVRKLMFQNLDGHPRRTRSGSDGPRQWVYGRQNQPCAKCGATIRMRRQGELGRSTYWCPNCQV